MDEVDKDRATRAMPDGVEVFEAEEDDSDLDWWSMLLGGLGTGAAGLFLAFKWEALVDGRISRRRGGVERLLDSVGQVPVVTILLAISAILLCAAAYKFNNERRDDQSTAVNESEGP